MRTRTMKLAFATAACAYLALAALPTDAIPVFPRKYGFNCIMCHSSYPRLNDYGIRYRQNGYQLPGRENDEKTVLESPAPFAMRITGGLTVDQFRNTAGSQDIDQFQLNGLDILSGGLMGRSIGYFMVYPPQIAQSRGVAGQTGTLEMGNVIFSNLAGTWLNVRGGRFEPAYDAFSVKRRLSFSPYEIYDFPGASGLVMADTQTGVELTGYGRCGWKYAAGWINGSSNPNTNPGDSPVDFYVRGVKVFGHGEGQTAGQRIGLTGYVGQARPAAGARQGFSRFGVDASFNYSVCNLAIQYLQGVDNQALAGAGGDFDFSGGFAELNYLPTTSTVGFARYDWVNSPANAALQLSDITRWTIGGRYYFVDNVALHLEYSRRRQCSFTPGLGDATEAFFTTALDFAF